MVKKPKRLCGIGLNNSKLGYSSFPSVNLFYYVKFFALGYMQESFPCYFIYHNSIKDYE